MSAPSTTSRRVPELEGSRVTPGQAAGVGSLVRSGPRLPRPGPVAVLASALLWPGAAAGDQAAAVETPGFTAVQPALFATPGAFTNAWADVDGDGDLDLFVGFGGDEAHRLYVQDAGRFTDVAPEAGLADRRPVRAAAWGDYDGDGDPDLLVGFAPGDGPVLKVYRNEAGGRRFVDVAAAIGLALPDGAVRQPVWVDYDGDGDLDLFLALRDRPNALFRNDGGRFSNVAPSLGLADPRRSVGAVWFDADEDGDLDVLVANMDGDANGLFRNDGARFVDVAEAAGLAAGGRALGDPSNGTVRPCVVDVDGDGRLDVSTANYGPNGLLLAEGGGRFRDVSAAWGLAAVDGRHDACAWADMDLDGRPDLYVNGTVTGGVQYPDRLYRNDGSRLVDVTPAVVAGFAADHGAQWADFDGDGDPDLALTGGTPEGTHTLLGNDLPRPPEPRHLSVSVLDAEGRATRAGAEVRLYAAGTRRLLGTRLVDAGSGYDAQSVQPVHFGLPEPGAVDVEITLPFGGRRVAALLRGVDPAEHLGRALVVRVAPDGRSLP